MPGTTTPERTPGGPPGSVGNNGLSPEELLQKIRRETNAVTKALLELQFYTTFGVPTYTLLHGQNGTTQHSP